MKWSTLTNIKAKWFRSIASLLYKLCTLPNSKVSGIDCWYLMLTYAVHCKNKPPLIPVKCRTCLTWYYLYSNTVLYLRFDNFTFSNLWAKARVMKTVEQLVPFSIKHRKNCECCPGHYLIVNHYSSMSWFKFRNSSEMVNCVTNSLNQS